MWPESFSLRTVNLEKKNCYSSRDIEFSLGGYFFGAPCRGKDFVKEMSFKSGVKGRGSDG